MTEAEQLASVKKGLGITSDYMDETLRIYIHDVKGFMFEAGVSQEVVESPASVGCILRGVSDLWNYGSGNVGFSDYFKQRVIQLCYATAEGEENV